MIHKVGYNSQRDNFSFGGKFKGWSQCFSTCSWMLMSFYDKKIEANNDIKLARYVDDVEKTVGKPGIAEKVVRKYKWITGKTSLWWAVQREGIENWLWSSGIEGDCIFSDCEYTIDDLPKLLENGPVILGTKKIGGLKGGHIILVTGYRDDYAVHNKVFIINDPYGNAMFNYGKVRNYNGYNIIYTYDYLKKHTSIKNNKIRCMYWKKP